MSTCSCGGALPGFPGLLSLWRCSRRSPRLPSIQSSSALLLGLTWGLGCTDSPTDTPPDDFDDTPIEALTISPPGVSLSGVGSTVQLEAEGAAEGGEPISNPYVTWSSLNPEIATVDAGTGLVTAVANGQVTVAAEGNGATAYALVTVSVPGLGPVAEWRFDNEPRPWILAVWGAAPTDVFAVGLFGAIYHYDGATWTEQPTPTGRDLYDVWGSSADNVHAVGSGGTILHFDGSAWNQVESGSSATLLGIWGSSEEDMFAVGDQGIILHFDGAAWSPMDPGISCRFEDVGGTSATDVFVAGCSGTVLHYDGTEWSGSRRAIDTSRLDELWVNGADDIYLVGWGIWHFDGAEWTDMNSPYGYLRAIWGAPSGVLFAVGPQGTILRYDGDAWTQMESGSTKSLEGIWGTSEDNVFAVGEGNTILHYDGTAWSTIRTGMSDHFEKIWGASPTDLYAVPSIMPVYHFDGTDWTSIQDPLFTSYVADVWGTSPSDVFVIGGNAPWWILHFDGSAWEVIPSLDYNFPKSIWGASPLDVFIVGGRASESEAGIVHRYNGLEWTRIHVVGDRELYDVWGSSTADVFAVGEGGTILHFDGSSWAEMESGTDVDLSAVWGTSATDLFAVGTGGNIFRYDGNGWTSMASGTTQNLRAVAGTSSTDVYAGGQTALLHFDGQAWTPVAEAEMGRVGVYVEGIWIDSDGDIVVVGGVGMILRGVR